MAKDLMITTQALIDISRRCVNAKSVDECEGCVLGKNMECQAFLIKELADRLDIRLQKRMIEEHPENYIVLPCPMGTKIFMIVSTLSRANLQYHQWIKETKLTYSNLQRVLDEWGDRVFLTRDEAEERLHSFFKTK
ncbi:MAG: hypothetical protein IJ410_03495 [Oscillospiraceae bacterium]|nr:hypothetical protein [Oscillospiraceae bacterium]